MTHPWDDCIQYVPIYIDPIKGQLNVGKYTSHMDPMAYLGGGFKYLYFHPYLQKCSNLTNIFQMGWFNHQLAWLMIQPIDP